uniref:Glycoside hydrolase family 38 central domain-containing protein n=1 Tax=Knipowitschia caucasica TaxID=637954 RepID=A0AAV2IVL9_KNICA
MSHSCVHSCRVRLPYTAAESGCRTQLQSQAAVHSCRVRLPYTAVYTAAESGCCVHSCSQAVSVTSVEKYLRTIGEATPPTAARTIGEATPPTAVPEDHRLAKDLRSFDGYYQDKTRHILDNVLQYLSEDHRGAEILYSLALVESRRYHSNLFPGAELFGHLTFGRRNLGLFQHHDAVTGTARDAVVRDYGERC